MVGGIFGFALLVGMLYIFVRMVISKRMWTERGHLDVYLGVDVNDAAGLKWRLDRAGVTKTRFIELLECAFATFREAGSDVIGAAVKELILDGKFVRMSDESFIRLVGDKLRGGYAEAGKEAAEGISFS